MPVFVDPSLNTSSVQWYSSLTMDGENLTRVNDSRVNFASSRGVVNASVIFRMADEEDAAYYFPVTEDVGLDRLSEIPPILVTCKLVKYCHVHCTVCMCICVCMYVCVRACVCVCECVIQTSPFAIVMHGHLLLQIDL